MRRRWLLLFLLAGCDKLFSIEELPLFDASTVDSEDSDGPVDALVPLTCPPGFSYDSTVGSYYLAISTARMFVAAASDCASREDLANFTGRTHIVVISNTTELDRLAMDGYWVGLSSAQRLPGDYIWVTEEPVQVAAGYWAPPPEPNNLTMETCAAYGPTNHLDTTDCTVSQAYVCECDRYPNDISRY